MKTRYSNLEIARAGLCTEGAVRNARKDGRLDDEDAENLAMFVLQMRMKAEGWGFMPDPVGDLLASGKLKTGADFETNPDEPECVPDHEHDEGDW